MVNIGHKAVRCQNSRLTANQDLLQQLEEQQTLQQATEQCLKIFIQENRGIQELKSSLGFTDSTDLTAFDYGLNSVTDTWASSAT